MRNYLIPANTKKSMLFFGMFNTFDLILVSCGVGISLLLLLALPIGELIFSIIAILPGLVTAFLVFPIPHYHNVLTIIKNVIVFYTSIEQFEWKGWCVDSEEKDDE